MRHWSSTPCPKWREEMGTSYDRRTEECAPFQKLVAPPAAALHITHAFGGEMAEWFKAHAWKACVAKHYRGFKSHSLRHFPLLNPHSLSSSRVLKAPPRREE